MNTSIYTLNTQYSKNSLITLINSTLQNVQTLSCNEYCLFFLCTFTAYFSNAHYILFFFWPKKTKTNNTPLDFQVSKSYATAFPNTKNTFSPSWFCVCVCVYVCLNCFPSHFSQLFSFLILISKELNVSSWVLKLILEALHLVQV